MNIVVHVALFCLVSSCIVALTTFYSEPDDTKALAVLPRRVMVFLASCAGVAGAMLLCEALFTSVS